MGTTQLELSSLPSRAQLNDAAFGEYVDPAGLPPGVYVSRRGEYPAVEAACQAVHTRRYLAEGYIGPSDLDHDGVFRDEYSSRANYVLARDEDRVAACRMIRCKGSLLSLPTAKHFSLDPDTVKEVAGVRRLSDLGVRDVVEISALVSESTDEGEGKKSRSMLSAMWPVYAQAVRTSLDEGHKLWLMNVEERHMHHLGLLMSSDCLHKLGEAREYMGPPTVPVALNPQKVVEAVLNNDSPRFAPRKERLKSVLHGVSDRRLSHSLKQALVDNGVEVKKTSRAEKLLTTRALATAAITLYSVARVLPAAQVEGFEGSGSMLLAIDVATAPTYVWGLAEAANGKDLQHRAIGASVAAGSFIAPYAYFWMNGEKYPPYVNAVIAAMISVAALSEVARLRKDERLEAGLLQA